LVRCKRLAISISGAVSLGSYEAGVLFELLYAIAQHNESGVPEEERIEIDVLTGASAGGMTATIVAHKLLFDAQALKDPYNNALYGPWIQDVDLRGLLALGPDEDPLKSLFSSDLIESISRRYLTDRYRSAPLRQAPHPAAPAEKLALGLALTNLNGLDYGLNLLGGGTFLYTDHRDQLCTWLTRGASDDTAGRWEPIRRAAISCGAFPFAFRPVQLDRDPADFADPDLKTVLGDHPSFAYTDGGTLNNEPLGMAKNLVDRIDRHLDADSRFYLFVAPRALKPASAPAFTADQAEFLPFGRKLISTIYNQAQFQDWVTVEGLNRQIQTLNDRATQLVELLLEAPQATIDSLEAAARALLPRLFNGDSAKIEPARARLAHQYSAELGKLSAATQPVFIDTILVLETAANLGDHEEMKVFAITDQNSFLASTGLFSFAGFFDQRYRDHDYDRGRLLAQRKLTDPKFPMGALRYSPLPTNRIDPRLDGLTLAQTDEQVRRDLQGLFAERAGDVAASICQPWLLRLLARPAVGTAVSIVVKKPLCLSD
jgi:hypothetical protein